MYSAIYPICDVSGSNYVGVFGVGGHVRYLNNSINYPTYKALSTRATGEIISDVD